MKSNAKLYKEAARMIAEEEANYSCLAIYDAIHGAGASRRGSEPIADVMVLAWPDQLGFRNAGHLQCAIETKEITGGDIVPDLLVPDLDARAHRVMLLLFAAEMCKTGDFDA